MVREDSFFRSFFSRFFFRTRQDGKRLTSVLKKTVTDVSGGVSEGLVVWALDLEDRKARTALGR
jgi:hypothetical protein